MSIERIYYCDSPEQNPDRPGYESGKPCGCNARTSSPPPYVPGGFLRIEEWTPNGPVELHFCSWDCVLRYAATKETTEFVDASDLL